MGFAHAIGKPHTLNEVYNVVAKRTFTWDQVTQNIAAALGAPVPKIVHIPTDLLVSIDPGRYGGLNEIFRYHGVYSNAKIHRDIPEFHEVTSFADAVRETIRWMEAGGKIKKAESDPFEGRLIEMYEAFCEKARGELTPKAKAT
jgi:nucleoside-diphosphate-sugar epimerase